MDMIKQIIWFFIEPFRSIGSKGVSEVLSEFLNKYKFVVYILAFLTTLIVISIKYFL